MERTDLHTLWETPKYLPYIQPLLTNEMVEEAEVKIGYKLPAEYIELLKTQNGGYIRFTLKETFHSQIFGIGPYFPSITNFEWLQDYEDSLSFNLKGLFPFDGDGHWNICLDYRRNEMEPEITYINTESDYQQPIAKTFKEYLNLLRIDAKDEFVIETNTAIEETLNEIAGIANIQFEEPDNLACGYPIYRGKYNESWVWISPNKVPDGFIRAGEDRYEELKHQMLPTSLRHAEVPGDYLFINFSNDVQRHSLLNILTKQGFKITELRTYFSKNPDC